MSSNKLFGLVIGVATGTGLILLISNPEFTSKQIERTLPNKTLIAEFISKLVLTPEPVPISNTASNTPSPGPHFLRDQLPSSVDYKKSVEVDPHGVPVIIKDFSAKLAQVMSSAMTDESVAKNRISDLGDCATQSEIQTIRLQCLVNLKRIQKQWPNLHDLVGREESRALPGDRDKLRALGY